MLSYKHKLRPIISIGAGGHFRSVSGFINESGFYIEDKFDFSLNQNLSLLTPLIKNIKSRFCREDLNFVICIGDNKKRSEIYYYLKEHVGIEDYQFPNVISKNSLLSKNTQIGFGNIIFPGVIVNNGVSISNFVILNTKCSIDHDCEIKDFSSIAPGVVLGGSVLVGKFSFIGIGAIVRNNIAIGCGSTLGGNSYLNGDMPENSLFYGVPAKKKSIV